MNGVTAPLTELVGTKDLERPTSVRWRILALLLAYSFMSWFNRVSMSVAGDEYLIKEYGIDKTDMGLVYSAFLLTYAICMTPGGWFIDRFGSWSALVIMGAGSALFGMCTGMLGWFLFTGTALWFGLLVVRGTMGLFTAPIYPASCRVVAHWLPFRQRAWANGMIMGAALVGIASTFVGFGSLIDVFGWEIAFVITGTITGVLAVAWTMYGRSHPAQHPSVNRAEEQLIRGDALKASTVYAGRVSGPGHGPRWLLLLRNRSLVLLTLSYAAVGYFEYLFYFWSHHYFEEVLKLGKDYSRVAATITNLSMAVGMFGGGWLADWSMRRFGYRLGRALIPVTGLLASALFLFLGIQAEEPAWIVAWFSLAMASVGACEGPMWATAIELGGRQAGTSAGIFNTGGNVGGLVAPVATPWVSDRYGWQLGIGLGGIVCLAGVLMWFWIDPHERCADPS